MVGVGNLRGEQGGIYIGAGESFAETTPFNIASCALIIQDTVLSALTQPHMTGTSKIVGVTLFAGSVIWGDITAMTVTSGLVQLFYNTKR